MKYPYQWAGWAAVGFSAAAAAFALEGYDPGGSGFPSRWTAPDRAEPIKYVVDTQAMPAGITTNQMLVAISNACRAWADVSSVGFEFDGFLQFGTDAISATSNALDRRIWIQCHNLYGGITTGNPAQGGRWQRWNSGEFPNGGLGGRVAANYFDEATAGYVMMDETVSPLTNAVVLEEVICHEMGHVLGLAHSSDNPGESDNRLKDAMMYFLVHGGGRGASLSDWDVDTIQLGQPTNNTPPYTYARVIDCVTAWLSSPTNIPGINQVDLRSYDLDGDSLSIILTNTSSSSGLWSLRDTVLVYHTTNFFDTPTRLDPADSSAYDRTGVVIFDGINLSPPVSVKVVSYNVDDAGWPSVDGLPDTWAATNGVSGATNDPDGDGMSNLAEWMNDTDPMDPDSALRITNFSRAALQWMARPYELYEVWSGTNLSSGFSLCGNPILPTATNANTSLPASSDSVRFYRVIKTP